MPTTWNPALYLKFQQERTQPSIDLVRRIEVKKPASILDVGCGPGNSTAVLAERWPQSRITGLDNSAEMIGKARTDFPDRDWVVSDARDLPDWRRYDIVYSNAAIQWIPDHETLVPRLLALVNPGGALAVQVPLYHGMPVRRVISEVAQENRWRAVTEGADSQMVFHDPPFYYDLVAPNSDRVSLWQTSYFHEMESHSMIVEMIRSTGMRPFLERLKSDGEREQFAALVLDGIKREYPRQANGRVLFEFRRFFFVAYR